MFRCREHPKHHTKWRSTATRDGGGETSAIKPKEGERGEEGIETGDSSARSEEKKAEQKSESEAETEDVPETTPSAQTDL